ncbi:MAG: hypothetical protein QF567_00195 [Candidatus Pacearchaeota archaeon]|jgi:hypothetical protein|nr:hypothetical protein [Candidatus Pacearchaeota archaeon]|tara:strand:- start:451 stop:996 length:546 start_codon:yes stop_codon:yes gene_type:complete
MEQDKKVIIIIAVIIVAIFLTKFNIKAEEPVVEPVVEEAPEPPKPQDTTPQVKYFSESSDKIVLTAGSQIIYTDNPVTSLTYYAVDGSGDLVSFKDGDRAFVRILGITRLVTLNTEIFHPETNGVEDKTLFTGEINIPLSGTYLVKVCLGPSINLDSEGTMVWPFGCFEDQSSVQMNVYDK